MIFGLSAKLQEAQNSVSIASGIGKHFHEVSLAYVIGAGASHQDPAGSKHLESAQVEFFVAAQGGLEIALVFGEGRGVENDGVVALAGDGVIFEQIEGVGLDPFDFFSWSSAWLSAAF
jgi:hypothetical protein